MTAPRRLIVTALLVVVVSTLALPLSATPAREATVWSTAWLSRWLEPWIPQAAPAETHPDLDLDGRELHAGPAPPSPAGSDGDSPSPSTFSQPPAPEGESGVHADPDG